MEIDWYARGKQVVHFQRGCAKQPGPDECVEFGDYTSVKSRLCTQSCSADLEDEEGTVGAPCNSGLEIHQKFAPEGKLNSHISALSYRTVNDEFFFFQDNSKTSVLHVHILKTTMEQSVETEIVNEIHH